MSDIAQTTQSAISKIYTRPLKEIAKAYRSAYERSIPELESVLHVGEYPEAVLFGAFRTGTEGPLDVGGLWSTNDRLLFVGVTGLRWRTKVVRDYSYDLLTAVEIQGGGTFSMPKMILRLAGTELQLHFDKGADVERYADLLRSKSRFAFGRRQAPATDDGDMLSKLERLTALRERGALTEDEFTAAKKALLGS